MTPLKAIKLKCLDCCCDQANEVTLCPVTDCTLFPFRKGKGNKREMTDEQREASAIRLRALRAKQQN